MSSVDPQLPLFLGLMSGTSADGIDAALVQFPHSGGCRFVHGLTARWEPVLRARLVALGEGGRLDSLEELGELTVTCEFCNRSYVFSPVEARTVFAPRITH